MQCSMIVRQESWVFYVSTVSVSNIIPTIHWKSVEDWFLDSCICSSSLKCICGWPLWVLQHTLNHWVSGSCFWKTIMTREKESMWSVKDKIKKYFLATIDWIRQIGGGLVPMVIYLFNGLTRWELYPLMLSGVLYFGQILSFCFADGNLGGQRESPVPETHLKTPFCFLPKRTFFFFFASF